MRPGTKIVTLFSCLTVIAQFGMAESARAVVSPPKRVTLTLADGREVQAIRFADEDGEYYVSPTVASNGRSSVAPHVGFHHRTAPTRSIVAGQTAFLSKISGRFHRPLIGQTALLAIRVAFPDQPGRVDAAEHSRLLFAPRGSLRAYFEQASEGQLVISGSVFPQGGGWFRLPKTMATYGADLHQTGGASTLHDRGSCTPEQFVLDAVLAADPTVDFSEFDWDGDGAVDHLLLLHAGDDQATSGRPEDLWSRQVVLPEPITLDGTRIESAMIVAETSPLGTLCHEFAHDLGAPDLYGDQDLGPYGLMSGGCWNGNPMGSDPAMLSAYLRWDIDGDPSNGKRGWIKPTSVRATGTVTIAGHPVLLHTEDGDLLVEYRSSTATAGFLAYRVSPDDWLPVPNGSSVLLIPGDTIRLGSADLWLSVVDCSEEAGVLELAPGEAQRTEALATTSSPGLSVYPNPFNSSATITLPSSASRGAVLQVFDLNGRLVAQLSARSSVLRWDGHDSYGRTLPSGRYFIRCSLPERTYTTSVILLR